MFTNNKKDAIRKDTESHIKEKKSCFNSKQWEDSYYNLLKNAKDAGLPVATLLYF